MSGGHSKSRSRSVARTQKLSPAMILANSAILSKIVFLRMGQAQNPPNSHHRKILVITLKYNIKAGCNASCFQPRYALKLLYSWYSPDLCLLKKSFVSFATTPLNAKRAIIFGIAISPLKISAIVHTALTVMYGPINTAKM